MARTSGMPTCTDCIRTLLLLLHLGGLLEGGYGRQRLWASLGWCMCSLPASWLAARFGADSAFVAFALLSLPLLVVCMSMRYRYSSSTAGKGKVPSKQQQQTQTQQPKAANGSMEQQQCHTQQGYSDSNTPEVAVSAVQSQPGMQRLLLQPAMLLFLWRCALLGFGVGILGTYEFLYLKQLGAPESLIGMALLVRGSMACRMLCMCDTLCSASYVSTSSVCKACGQCPVDCPGSGARGSAMYNCFVC